MNEETVPCELCATPTPQTGTKRCDSCWELESRIKGNPDLAAQILSGTGKVALLGTGQVRSMIEGARGEERERIYLRMREEVAAADALAETDDDVQWGQNVSTMADAIRNEWGPLDDYEPGQRHIMGATGPTGGSPEGKFSEPWSSGDALFHEGHGIEVSRHKMGDWKTKLGRCVRADEIPEYRGLSGPSYGDRALVPEDEILRWADMIMASRAMKQRLGLHVERRNKKHGAQLHPGTDAVRGQSDMSGDQDDHFDTDASESTILITTPSSTAKHLNATAYAHHSFISIRITGPDGRALVDISLSHDQFARALTTCTTVPCTVDRYWSHSPTSVLLTERVRKPVSIRKRMAKRLEDLIQRVSERVDRSGDEVRERLEQGKAPTKTQAQTLVDAIPSILDLLKANLDFVVSQGLEEAGEGIERVLTQILVANQHAIPDGNQILAMLPDPPRGETFLENLEGDFQEKTD